MAADDDRHGRCFGCVFMCYCCRIVGVCRSLDGAYLFDKLRPESQKVYCCWIFGFWASLEGVFPITASMRAVQTACVRKKSPSEFSV